MFRKNHSSVEKTRHGVRSGSVTSPVSHPHRILVFDQASPSTERVGALLHDKGYEVLSTEFPEEALEALRTGEVELILSEVRMGAQSLLEQLATEPRETPLILFEDFGGFGPDIEAAKAVAFETLPRPVSDEQVLSTVRRALQQIELREENRRLREEVGDRFSLGNLLSRDARMRRIFSTIEAVADSNASLLIQGESGTGKTMLARAVHEGSMRKDAPFIVVNCGAIPAALLESELFGHVKGAFTGAVRDREGKFEAADGGTIFLDEIGTASSELQVKLLRVLEEGRFERVGDTNTRTVDARLVAATNVDLAEEVAEGRFRRDLYYRIHVVAIEMPPLRQRSGDIALLAERFLELHSVRYGRSTPPLGEATTAALVAHHWPGNVRELENTLERAVLLSRGDPVEPEHLWPDSIPETRPLAPAAEHPWAELPLGPLRQILEVPERFFIERALKACAGNRQSTASKLGINRTTLFNKMRKFDLLDFPTKDKGPEGPT